MPGCLIFFYITRKNCQSNLVVVLVLRKVSITSHSTAFSIIYLYYCMCFAYHSVAELCIKKRYGQDNMDLDCKGVADNQNLNESYIFLNEEHTVLYSIESPEHWKSHFRALKFQNFQREHAPRPL